MPHARPLPVVTIAALAGLLAACEVVRTPYHAPGVTGDQRFTPAEVARSVEAAMDRSVDPCVDFYRYACGGWMKTTTMPPDRSRLGRAFTGIQERNRQVLREVLEEAVRRRRDEPDEQRLARFYGSCMDTTAIERLGVDTVRPILAVADAVQDQASLMRALGTLHPIGVDALFTVVVFADFKNPGIDIAQFFQGGLGLPDRDNYLADDEAARALRRAYEAHVARMLALIGEPEEAARADAAAILAFETRLAGASLPRDQARDFERIYNRLDRAGLQAQAPALDWEGYFDALDGKGVTAINVGMPAFFAALSSIVPETPAETLRAYLRHQILRATADELPRAFVDEHFEFYGKVLSGQQELEPRWKRCVDATDEAIGEILGRGFVERAFPGDSKEQASRMIRTIEAALEQSLPGLGWMDDATRERAAGKLHAVNNKIGYPERWRDYGGLDLRGAFYLNNRRAAKRFEFRRLLAKVGKPIDRDEWGMTPPTVNAYYNPALNEMVFPAGILQPPVFHRDFPRALNYGGIGTVMGHELTHGFDDQGRKFDATGLMSPWWDPAAVAKFEERAACVERLYGTYEVEPGLTLNGTLTLGENIADLGGLKEAFTAYRASVAEQGPESSPVPGLTPEQLFFIGFAQTWCELVTPERARVLQKIDPHSPGRYRVIGPVSNLPAFAETFACAPGTPMNPVDRCEVW